MAHSDVIYGVMNRYYPTLHVYIPHHKHASHTNSERTLCGVGITHFRMITDEKRIASFKRCKICFGSLEKLEAAKQ